MPANHYQSRINWQRKWADTSLLGTFWRQFLDIALPLLKPTGHLITFCNHESYPVFYPLMYGRFDFCKSLIWDKKNVGLGRVWRNQHELIIAARWNTSVFYDDGVLRPDVLSHRATPSATREHPVEKPESLLLDLITPTTKPGDVVLDPFSGSGTTGLAAIKTGRRAICIELDTDYFNAQEERFANHVAQGKLFTPEAPIHEQGLLI
jgi:DNA modification methylase